MSMTRLHLLSSVFRPRSLSRLAAFHNLLPPNKNLRLPRPIRAPVAADLVLVGVAGPAPRVEYRSEGEYMAELPARLVHLVPEPELLAEPEFPELPARPVHLVPVRVPEPAQEAEPVPAVLVVPADLADLVDLVALAEPAEPAVPEAPEDR